jgi:hypothetical protein
MALPISWPYPPMEALSNQNGTGFRCLAFLRWRPDKVPKACSMTQSNPRSGCFAEGRIELG